MNGMLLFFGNNTVATAIFWALGFPIGILSYASYAYFLYSFILLFFLSFFFSSFFLSFFFNFFPFRMITFQAQIITNFITSPKNFRIILIFFGMELTTVFVFLLGFSEYWNLIGDFETSNTLFIAAFYFFIVNLIIFLPYHLYCSIVILKMMGKRDLQVSQTMKLILFKVAFFFFFSFSIYYYIY